MLPLPLFLVSRHTGRVHLLRARGRGADGVLDGVRGDIDEVMLFTGSSVLEYRQQKNNPHNLPVWRAAAAGAEPVGLSFRLD